MGDEMVEGKQDGEETEGEMVRKERNGAQRIISRRLQKPNENEE